MFDKANIEENGDLYYDKVAIMSNAVNGSINGTASVCLEPIGNAVILISKFPFSSIRHVY